MSYKRALAALEAYEPKRLAEGTYWDAASGCHCAIGAICPETSKAPALNILRLCDLRPELVARLQALGLSRSEAHRLQVYNDLHTFLGPADRYEGVCAWLRARLAEEETST